MYIIYSSWELHYFECRRKSRCYSPPSSSKSNGLLVSILFFFSDGLSRLREIHLSNCAYMAASLPINIPDTPPARYWRMDVTDFHEHTATKKREREKTGKRASAIPTIYKWARHVISPVSLVAHCFLFLFLFFLVVILRVSWNMWWQWNRKKTSRRQSGKRKKNNWRFSNQNIDILLLSNR